MRPIFYEVFYIAVIVSTMDGYWLINFGSKKKSSSIQMCFHKSDDFQIKHIKVICGIFLLSMNVAPITRNPLKME